MNVKAIRMNALERMEKTAQKQRPALKTKDSLVGHKQNVAQRLLEREEANARRSRMESLLTQQFIGKYGSKAPSSRINAFIKATVHDFLHSYNNMNVAESMIESLESQIEEITNNMKNEINQVRSDSRQQSQLQRQQEQMQLKLMQQNQNQDKQQNSRRNSGAMTMNAQGNLEPSWAMLNAISAAEAEAKEEAKKRLAHERTEKYKKDLDKQRDSLRNKDNKDENAKLEQHAINVRVAAEYEAELIAKKEARKMKGTQEREMRMQQIEYNEMLRSKEKQMKIMAEKADMARSRRLATSEADALKIKKDLRAAQVEKVKAENEENKRLKQIAKEKQWEYEAKLNKDYEAKLEREEKARVDAFNARVEALKKFESSGATVAAAAAAKKESDMAKTLMEIEAKYQKDADALEAKKQQRQKDMVASRDFNVTLIERKQRMKEEERQADIDRRRMQQIELDLENKRNEEKKQKKHQAMQDLKSKLDEQVQRRHNNEKFSKSASLSDKEIEYNKMIIKKIEADPKLLQQVMQRVKPTPAGGMGDFKYG